MAIQKKFNTIDDVLKDAKTNIYFNKNEEMFLKFVNFLFSCKELARHLLKEDARLVAWVI